MPDCFVKNTTNPVPSTNELGTHVQINSTNPNDAFTAYAALHPVANGDTLRCIFANSVTLVVAAPGPQVFNPTTMTLPAVGA
jgi:hypothetical protein